MPREGKCCVSSLPWKIEASAVMDFEQAASLRDQIVKLKGNLEGRSEEDILGDLKKTARKGSQFGRRKRK